MLNREEYVEQSYLFATLAERIRQSMPSQEVLQSIKDEILVTTKLPMAIDYLSAELRHGGAFGPAMVKLKHYFTPFQAYVISEAEDERGRSDAGAAGRHEDPRGGRAGGRLTQRRQRCPTMAG